MRRWILWSGVLVLLALVGFYGAWPAWSGWRIKSALDQRDATLLSRKVDFDAVRASLMPAVRSRVDQQIDERIAQSGTFGQVIGPKLKSEFAPKIADLALTTLVTPENMIRIAADGGSIKDSVERILREQLPKIGGVVRDVPVTDQAPQQAPGAPGAAVNRPGSGQAETAAAAPVSPGAPQQKPGFSLANIKRFVMTGPVSFAVSVARDPAAREHDLTAEMAFRGGDWKLVGLVPRL